MKIIFKKNYKRNRESALTSLYVNGIFMFAEKWADEMEKLITKGKKIKDIAKKTSVKIDKEMGGITGYMYNCAVAILSRFWKYGDRLRKWHNVTVQMRNEGEEANKRKSVLNSAIINLRS